MNALHFNVVKVSVNVVVIASPFLHMTLSRVHHTCINSGV